ncbi:hypothetical protein KY332_04490 [Candidatus Woesearchaeota archaeon]|nr:hypothetical protein [Candidatus Woesearchaeota archaeon]
MTEAEDKGKEKEKIPKEEIVLSHEDDLLDSKDLDSKDIRDIRGIDVEGIKKKSFIEPIVEKPGESAVKQDEGSAEDEEKELKPFVFDGDEEMAAELDKVRRKNEDLEAKNEEFTNENKQLQEKIDEQINLNERQAKDFSAKHLEFETEGSNLQKKIDELDFDLGTSKRLYERTTEDFKKYKSDAMTKERATKQALEEKEKKVEELERSLAQKENELNQKQAEAEKSEESQEELDKLQQQVNSLLQEKEDLIKEADGYKNYANTLEDAIKEQQPEIDSFKEDFTKLRQDKGGLQTKINDAYKELEELKNAKKVVEKEYAELKQSSEQESQKIAETIGKKSEEIKNLQERISTFDQEKIALEQSNEELQRRVDKEAAIAERLNNENQGILKELGRTNKDMQELRETYAKYRKGVEPRIAGLAADINNKNKEINILEQKIEEKEKEVKLEKEKISIKESARGDVNKKIDQFINKKNKEIEELEDILAHKIKDIDFLHGRVDYFKEKAKAGDVTKIDAPFKGQRTRLARELSVTQPFSKIFKPLLDKYYDQANLLEVFRAARSNLNGILSKYNVKNLFTRAGLKGEIEERFLDDIKVKRIEDILETGKEKEAKLAGMSVYDALKKYAKDILNKENFSKKTTTQMLVEKGGKLVEYKDVQEAKIESLITEAVDRAIDVTYCREVRKAEARNLNFIDIQKGLVKSAEGYNVVIKDNEELSDKLDTAQENANAYEQLYNNEATENEELREVCANLNKERDEYKNKLKEAKQEILRRVDECNKVEDAYTKKCVEASQMERDLIAYDEENEELRERVKTAEENYERAKAKLEGYKLPEERGKKIEEARKKAYKGKTMEEVIAEQKRIEEGDSEGLLSAKVGEKIARLKERADAEQVESEQEEDLDKYLLPAERWERIERKRKEAYREEAAEESVEELAVSSD